MGRLTWVVVVALVPFEVIAAIPPGDEVVQVRGFQSRCIVASSEKALLSLAKNLASGPRTNGAASGYVATTIALSDRDCLRFHRYSWGAPEADVDDKVYVERRDALRRERVTVARVVRDSAGSSLFVRSGGRVQTAVFGRKPESFAAGANLCQLLQITGGQSTEVPGTQHVRVFMSCKRGSFPLAEAQKLVYSFRQRTGIGSSYQTRVMVFVNSCPQFRDVMFPAWYAFADDYPIDGCAENWESLVYSWRGETCVNADSLICTSK